MKTPLKQCFVCECAPARVYISLPPPWQNFDVFPQGHWNSIYGRESVNTNVGSRFQREFEIASSVMVLEVASVVKFIGISFSSSPASYAPSHTHARTSARSHWLP